MTEQEQIDELKAQVNRLRHCLEQARNDKDKEAFERCYGRTLAMTSNQCLAEVKAKAIEEAVEGTFDDFDCITPFDLRFYANRLREQAK